MSTEHGKHEEQQILLSATIARLRSLVDNNPEDLTAEEVLPTCLPHGWEDKYRNTASEHYLGRY